MIVDDHTSFRRLARLLLLAAGFEVVGEAADAGGARELIARLEPDAVRSRSDFGASFDLPGGCEFIPKHELSGSALAQLLGGA